MLGFIVCTAKAKRGLDTDDETLREITETDAGETDIIINVADISYIFEAEETTVMQMISGSQIELTDTLDAIIQKIFDQDVSVNVHFIPVPKMSFYTNLGYNLSHYPVAEDNFVREISLPIFVDLTDEQIVIVVNAVVNAVKQVIG